MRFWSRLRGRGSSAGPPAPFIVGVARSGTTLLRLMLDAHPQLAIPPETHFIPKLIKACEEGGDPHERVLELLTTHRRWPDYRLDAEELRERLDRIQPLTAGDAMRAFYGLYADPRVLLVLQSVLFAIGGVPIYWLARHRLGKLWGVLFVSCYLSSPALTYASLFDFHSVALIEPVLSFAVRATE